MKHNQTEPNAIYNYVKTNKPYNVQTHFGKSLISICSDPYYSVFNRSAYLEYFWELIDFIRDIEFIDYSDYVFYGRYYEPTTNTVEKMWDMQIYEDDSVSFDYKNICVAHTSLRVSLKDVFDIFMERKDSIAFMKYCFKCFSLAAK